MFVGLIVAVVADITKWKTQFRARIGTEAPLTNTGDILDKSVLDRVYATAAVVAKTKELVANELGATLAASAGSLAQYGLTPRVLLGEFTEQADFANSLKFTKIVDGK